MMVLMDHLESELQRIQSGNERMREQLIESGMPFIRRVVRQVVHAWPVDQLDEFSIALEAFNHAISHYRIGDDVPFEPYARLLIRNRLFDWMRCQKRARQELTMTDCETEDGSSPVEQLADPVAECVQQDLEFADAMVLLEARLAHFGLSFPVLAAGFPRHQDSRLTCIRIARELAGDQALMRQLQVKRQIPGAELSRRCQVPIKTIEKNRSSIILLTLLMQSDLDQIKSNMALFERENSR